MTNVILSNPYDWELEVTDPKLFAGRRRELERIERELARFSAHQHPTLMAIVGERRVGKTSLILRIIELCKKLQLLPVYVFLNLNHAISDWEFWQITFRETKNCLKNAGVDFEKAQIGYTITPEEQKSYKRRLFFEDAYNAYHNKTGSSTLTSDIIEQELEYLSEIAISAGYSGIVLIYDEAHVLQEVQESTIVPKLIKQQLRRAIRISKRYSLIFSGEVTLSHIFNDYSEPLYLQGSTIALSYFSDMTDIAECAILPLKEEERPLMSPMTIDYLSRMSRGKPNQIRFICYSIYERYSKHEQSNLNISMEVMDNIIDFIESEFSASHDMKQQIERIRGLNSIDLEILFNLTRYPNWALSEVIELDESFRGDRRSELAKSRRQTNLRKKVDSFISDGILVENDGNFSLPGGEYVSLYLRFWYEVRRYGRLSKKLVLGKGPETPFAEKTEKLAMSIAWELRYGPGIRRFVLHPDCKEDGETIISEIKKRFTSFQSLMNGQITKDADLEFHIRDCIDICEFIKKSGSYYLVCLSVRNLEIPRELMQIELYFDYAAIVPVNITSLLKLVGQQSSDARIIIEGADAFKVELLTLKEMLEAIGAPKLDELITRCGTVEKWRISSVRRIVESKEEGVKENEEEEDEELESKTPDEWIKLHASRRDGDAVKVLQRELQRIKKRHKRTRLYNDLGYIWMAQKNFDPARKSLETAIDLHYFDLPLTILNLSFLDILQSEYERAIQRINTGLLLIISRVEIEAGYLNTILPACHLNYRTIWEHHPANLIEVAYINLAYALLNCEGIDEALAVIGEGLDIIPSSKYLKHALARYYLYQKNAKLADPLYIELLDSKDSISDQALLQEIQLYAKFIPRKLKRRR